MSINVLLFKYLHAKYDSQRVSNNCWKLLWNGSECRRPLNKCIENCILPWTYSQCSDSIQWDRIGLFKIEMVWSDDVRCSWMELTACDIRHMLGVNGSPNHARNRRFCKFNVKHLRVVNTSDNNLFQFTIKQQLIMKSKSVHLPNKSFHEIIGNFIRLNWCVGLVISCVRVCATVRIQKYKYIVSEMIDVHKLRERRLRCFSHDSILRTKHPFT